MAFLRIFSRSARQDYQRSGESAGNGLKTAKAGKIADDPPELSGIRENSLSLRCYENRTK